jgi:glyoxylase-like metal-dependent hydrolase (beta-lactamase superfamily II)
MEVKALTFNDFAENTYILWDETEECAIVDPGCSNVTEERRLVDFIESRGLKPTLLINTHAHIDHVFGIDFVNQKWGLKLHIHRGEQPMLDMLPQISKMYGLNLSSIEAPIEYIEEGDSVSFGHTTLNILFTPGHSPASVCFSHAGSKQLIAGDVLFQGSIGRTDLPGGDYDTLIASITDKLFPLGDDVIVYPGHGPATTIEVERKSNPFLIGLV